MLWSKDKEIWFQLSMFGFIRFDLKLISIKKSNEKHWTLYSLDLKIIQQYSGLSRSRSHLFHNQFRRFRNQKD